MNEKEIERILESNIIFRDVNNKLRTENYNLQCEIEIMKLENKNLKNLNEIYKRQLVEWILKIKEAGNESDSM